MVRLKLKDVNAILNSLTSIQPSKEGMISLDEKITRFIVGIYNFSFS